MTDGKAERGGKRRFQVFYRGRVQGVGFRYTARRLAAGLALTGFVRNLADGRVELVAEGEAGEVEAYLQALETRMGDLIRGAERTVTPAAGRWTGFDIRY